MSPGREGLSSWGQRIGTKTKSRKLGVQEGGGDRHTDTGTEPEAASGDRRRDWREPVGQRGRETGTDAVSFSPNLHKITGLGRIPRDSGRGGEEEANPGTWAAGRVQVRVAARVNEGSRPGTWKRNGEKAKSQCATSPELYLQRAAVCARQVRGKFY